MWEGEGWRGSYQRNPLNVSIRRYLSYNNSRLLLPAEEHRVPAQMNIQVLLGVETHEDIAEYVCVGKGGGILASRVSSS